MLVMHLKSTIFPKQSHLVHIHSQKMLLWMRIIWQTWDHFANGVLEKKTKKTFNAIKNEWGKISHFVMFTFLISHCKTKEEKKVFKNVEDYECVYTIPSSIYLHMDHYTIV